MNQKTKLKLLKEKICALRNKKVENQDATIDYIETKESKFKKNVITGALVTTLAATSLIGINEIAVNHATDMCIASKTISIFDKQASINHQISGIKSDFKDAENLNIEYQDAHYSAPTGYVLEGDKAIKYIEPTQQVRYFASDGYILQGTKGVKNSSDGTKKEVDATRRVTYTVPNGYIMTYDENDNILAYKTTAAKYHESTITTTTDEEIYTLKMKR